MDQETVIYLAFSCLSILFLLMGSSNFGALGPVVSLLAIATLVFILMLNYVDFLIFPVFTQILGITVTLSGTQSAPKEQNRVVKSTKGLYYATGYLTANLYNYAFRTESIVGGEDQMLSEAPDKWERIVMNVDFPFKFSVVSNPQDIQKYREDLEGDRSFLDFQINKESSATTPNQMTIAELERKKNVLQARIDRISGGELPINTMMYIETTAVGVSDKAAADALTNQLNRLETVFNSFDMNITRIAGREVHTLFKLNYVLFEPADMLKLFQTQK